MVMSIGEAVEGSSVAGLVSDTGGLFDADVLDLDFPGD